MLRAAGGAAPGDMRLKPFSCILYGWRAPVPVDRTPGGAFWKFRKEEEKF
jgi:hypothetical protein